MRYAAPVLAASVALVSVCAGAVEPGRAKRFARVNPVFPSSVRPRLRLDGEWEFRMDPSDKGREDGWTKAAVAFPNTIRVPGAWEAQGFGGPRLATRYQGTPVHLRGSYRGAAWYRKTVGIPLPWRGKRIWLKFGGVNPSADVWCNGVYLGHHARYFEPFKFDVTDIVPPGKPCSVVVRIDNRDQPDAFGQGGGAGGCLTILWPWGGIHRSVALEATARASVQRAVIVPDLDRGRVEVRVHLEDDPPPTARLQLQAEARLLGDAVANSSGKAAVLAGRKSFVLSLAVSNIQPWSPAAPRLYRLDLRLSDGDTLLDIWSERFGFCKREVRGNDVFLNNRKVFIRGYGNDCVYPLTIAPPASRELYRQRFQRARAFGFTYARHHTWAPLPEYYDAADEVGIMLQPELLYGGPVERLDALIRNYRNHPSLATYSMTNEAYRGREMLAKLYHRAKALDPARFAIDSDGAGGPVRPTADLWVIGGTPPDTAPAFRTKPVIYHEFLNLPTIPDPSSRPKFTGGFKPTAMEDLAAYAKAKGLEQEVGQAVRASRHLQMLYQKEGIERARRQRELDGYCYWTIADFWEFGQGLFDMFWQPKGWSAGEFRRFNAAACVLAELPGHTAWQGDRVPVKFLVSNYTGRDIGPAHLDWKLTDGQKPVAAGSLRDVTAPKGTVTEVGSVLLVLPELGRHAKLVLQCELAWPGSSLQNEWELWTYSKGALAEGFPARIRLRGRATALRAVYPKLSAKAGPELLVAEALQPSDLDFLRSGGRVVLVSAKTFAGMPVRLHPGWWRSHPSNQVGLAIRRHPALAGFPHDGAAGFQIQSILKSVVTVDRLPFKVAPIIYGLTYPFPRIPASEKKLRGQPPELRSCLFEFPVGAGIVLVSGLELLADVPESRALLDCLLRYATGPDFQSKTKDGPATLALLTPTIEQFSVTKRVVPPKARPGGPVAVEIRVSNKGALPCEVIVADALPAGVETLDILRWTLSVRGGEERTLWYMARAAKTGSYTLLPARLTFGDTTKLSRPTVLSVAPDAPALQLPRFPRPPAAATVAAWSLDEAGGRTARDRLGKHPLALRDVTWSYGVAGTALRFNGRTSRASTPDRDELDLRGPLTVMLCAWPAKLTRTEQCLIDKGGSSRRNYGIYLVGSELLFLIHAGGREHKFRTRGLKLRPRTWYHIACSYDRKRARILVNGRERLNQRAALGDLTPTNTPLFLGYRGPQNDMRFDGLIDEVTILRTAR